MRGPANAFGLLSDEEIASALVEKDITSARIQKLKRHIADRAQLERVLDYIPDDQVDKPQIRTLLNLKT